MNRDAMTSSRERLAQLLREKAERDKFDWTRTGRANQQIPPGDWRTWLYLAGRGAGKTRTLSEVVRIWQRTSPLVNIIAATTESLRAICIERPSGILATAPPAERPVYFQRGTYSNGRTAQRACSSRRKRRTDCAGSNTIS